MRTKRVENNKEKLKNGEKALEEFHVESFYAEWNSFSEYCVERKPKRQRIDLRSTKSFVSFHFDETEFNFFYSF